MAITILPVIEKKAGKYYYINYESKNRTGYFNIHISKLSSIPNNPH